MKNPVILIFFGQRHLSLSIFPDVYFAASEVPRRTELHLVTKVYLFFSNNKLMNYYSILVLTENHNESNQNKVKLHFKQKALTKYG